MDVASLLNPLMEVPCKPATKDSQPAMVESDDQTSHGLPTIPHDPDSPTSSVSQPAKVFPIFNAGEPSGKKRKVAKLTATPARTVQHRGTVGMSRSARVARERNQQVAEGTFVTDNALLLQFKRKIRLIDPDASFMVNGNIKSVKHSLCGRSVMMKAAAMAHFLQK